MSSTVFGFGDNYHQPLSQDVGTTCQLGGTLTIVVHEPVKLDQLEGNRSQSNC